MLRSDVVMSKLILVLLCAVVLFTSCTKQKAVATGWDYNSTSEGSYASNDIYAIESSGNVRSKFGKTELDVNKSQAAKLDEAQKLIYQANLTIEGKSVDTLGDELMDFAKKYEGYLSNQNTYRVTMRVPIQRYEEAMEGLDLNYHVIDKRVDVNDVTFKYSDLSLRIENTEQARMKYLALLDQAQNVEEALLVEKELERLNLQYDVLNQQLKGLDGQIEYTTIHISLKEKVKLGVLGAIGKGVWIGVKWLFVRN